MSAHNTVSWKEVYLELAILSCVKNSPNFRLILMLGPVKIQKKEDVTFCVLCANISPSTPELCCPLMAALLKLHQRTAEKKKIRWKEKEQQRREPSAQRKPDIRKVMCSDNICCFHYFIPENKRNKNIELFVCTLVYNIFHCDIILHYLFVH